MMPSIDRKSPVPLYFQLKQILLGKIESGEWRTGQQVEGELEIGETYNLSRTTVRQSLGELVADGHLVRHRGRGTFVAALNRTGKLTHNPDHALGLHEAMALRGLKPGWTLVEKGWVDRAPELVVDRLMLESTQRVYRIVRLRLADEEPIGWHEAWLPESIAQRINHGLLTEGESKSYLLHLPELRQGQATRTLEAVSASDEDSRLLGIEIDLPILQVQRVVTVEAMPVEFLCARYLGHCFKYQITGHL